MSYSNLRVGRTSIPGYLYLVTTVTKHRERVFDDYLLGRIVVNAMRVLDEESVCRTLAFVIMPDHVHWLFELGHSHTLSQAMKLFKGRTSVVVNSYLKKTGLFWQPSFHDHAVRTDESLIDIARYIVMNPVRASLVKHIGDHPLWDCIWIDPL